MPLKLSVSGEKDEHHWVQGWGYRVGVLRFPNEIVCAVGVFEQQCVAMHCHEAKKLQS
jgi:hypothetical protein